MNVALRAGAALLGLCLGAGVQGGDTPAEMDGGPSRAGYSAGYAFGGQLARLQGQKPVSNWKRCSGAYSTPCRAPSPA